MKTGEMITMLITKKQLAYLEALRKRYSDAELHPFIAKLRLEKPFYELTKREASELISTLKEAGLELEEIDTEAICRAIDLRTLADRYTTLSGSPTSKEWYGPCPLCRGDDRFHATAEWFFCRRCHPKRGNAIEFIMWLKELEFFDACAWLSGGRLPTHSPDEDKPKPAPRPRPRVRPPDERWQGRARAFIKYTQRLLWRPEGHAGLEYLLNRGLTEATIRAAGLGYNPVDIHDKSSRWGVTDKESIWLPGPGIVIPWPIESQFWRVNIRLLEPRMVRHKSGKEDKIKYIGPAGWSGANPLYNADGLRPDKPAILVEGEFCALTINQEAGDLITAVATGSTEASRADKWIDRLSNCSLVLVAFDAEPDKGDRAAQVWLELLSNAKRWRPTLKDVNEMHCAKLDIRAWIIEGLHVATLATGAPEAEATSFPYVTIRWPAGSPLATIKGQSRLVGDETEAWYESPEEWHDCLEWTRWAREPLEGEDPEKVRQELQALLQEEEAGQVQDLA
jgi:hypothetical protein